MKKETNLERIQREVFSYDTEAGYRLRYHITRALIDERYAKKIDFNTRYNLYGTALLGSINNLFIFDDTSEGFEYWAVIAEGLRNR